MAIVALFLAHWYLSVFVQSSFHHRYAAHRMFTMPRVTEKLFHLFAWVVQGSSYLSPRAYAILHREHHAYSDTPKDPHSPVIYRNPLAMMWNTAERYTAHVERRAKTEQRFLADTPEWPAVEAMASTWTSRIFFATAWVLVYWWLATAWWQWMLLPVTLLMGPFHGAIVNWCGHRYGYRNFATRDASRNTIPVDIVTMGELFQNNHHRAASRINFAARGFEIDPTYVVLVVLDWMRVIRIRGADGMAAAA